MPAHHRVATLLAGFTLLAAAPAVAQDAATVYLKEGGTIRGQIVDDTDPNGIKIRSEKSGTTFMLKRTWVDSVVRPTMASAAAPAPSAKPAAAKPATPPGATAAAALSSAPTTPPAAAPASGKPLSLEPKPVEPKPVAARPAEAKPVEPMPAAVQPAASPATAAAVPVAAGVAAPPVVDGLEPPTNVPTKQVKAEKQKKAANPVRNPSRWYIGGGGAAYTGTVGDATDIGYSGMIGYGSGLSNAVAVRLGASGSYWRLGTGAGDFYDVAGNFDLIVGPRGPRFVAPYAVLGGMGGVRSISPVQVGATGYTRDPLYGARLGAGFSAKRVFLEASYQHVWVDGVSSGYVPFVFGFRF